MIYYIDSVFIVQSIPTMLIILSGIPFVDILSAIMASI